MMLPIRKAGEFLKNNDEIGKGKKSSKLADFGLDEHQSHRWQLEAKVSEDRFEKLLPNRCPYIRPPARGELARLPPLPNSKLTRKPSLTAIEGPLCPWIGSQL